jgi:uncharacterized protein (TIGR02246 family)
MRIALVILLVVGCGAPQHPATATEDVAALRDRWLQAFNAKQLDAAIATYAIDAVFLPITGDRVQSAMAIKELYTRIWRQFTPHMQLTSHQLERFGDLAYETGEYDETIAAAEGTLALRGSYVFVYRHEADGWRIAAQTWTEVSALPPAR